MKEAVNRIFNQIKHRSMGYKLMFTKDERLPLKVRQEIRAQLFTEKQKEVIAVSKMPDLQLLIHHGGTGSGKTFVNNFLFLDALMRVRKEADETRGADYTPIVILAGYKQENVVNNIIMPLQDEYGLDIKFDKNGNFNLFGVKVVTTFLNSPRGEASIRGLDAWFCYVNEATTANQSAFEELRKRLRGGRRPFMIADTNPDHPLHWLKKDYIDRAYSYGEERNLELEEAKRKTKGLYQVSSTPEDNPYLERSYIQSLFDLPEGPSRDRALGMWTTGKGSVYEHFRPDLHYVSREELPPRSAFSEYFVGVDWGWRDPTVFMLFGKADVWNADISETEEVTFLLEEVTKTETHMEYWQKLAERWMEEYGVGIPFYCDSAEQDRIAKLFEVGANASNANKNITMGIETVSKLIQYGQFKVLGDNVKEFKKEITSYEWNERTGLPIDLNNHTMDALRYAIHTHAEEGGNSFTFN